ncbi:MAG: PIN domain-containing protein, partial [Bacteroidetes bacterium]|nr:PIN domain-containing protein [Bacteroidota bacterium]
MAKYLIDSNILIYALKGIHEASSVISKLIDSDEEIYFSFITRLELMCEKYISDENKIKIDNLLGQLIRVDYNYKIEEYIINFS